MLFHFLNALLTGIANILRNFKRRGIPAKIGAGRGYFSRTEWRAMGT